MARACSGAPIGARGQWYFPFYSGAEWLLRQRTARNVGSATAECSQHDPQIQWIDAVARQPQAMYSQDRLRNERQVARDRQFRLHCQ
jgi:hypothetical protein